MPPQLPHNLEAEQAVLGALLFDNELFHRLPTLHAESFYDPVHGRIFEAAARLIRAGRVADGVTLKALAAKDGGIAEIGGAAYLLKLLDAAAPLSSQALSYAELIRDLAQRRRLITACYETADLSITSEDADAASILAQHMSALDHIVESESASTWQPLTSIMDAAVSRAKTGKLVGVSTGIKELDQRINGLRPETFVVIGGRVKMGKTTVGMSIACAVADQRPAPDAPKYGVAIFSLEMDEDQIGLRGASDLAFTNRPIYSGVSRDPGYFDAMRGELDSEQWRWMQAAARSRDDWNVEVDFTPALTPSQIESRCRRLFRKWRQQNVTPMLVMIDHMGHVRPDRRNGSRSAERSDVIDDLDALKKKLGVCVLGLSQINRAGDTDTNARPNNTHLEWSDRIAANAQAVVLIYREEYYLLRKPELNVEETERLRSVRNTIELIVDIVRGGNSGTVKARVNLPTASLRDLEKPA